MNVTPVKLTAPQLQAPYPIFTVIGSSLFFFHANGTPVGLTHSSIIYSGRVPCAAPGLLHKSLSNKVIGSKRSELSSREHGSIILGIPNFEQPNDARSCRKSKYLQGARCPLCNSFLQKKRMKIMRRCIHALSLSNNSRDCQSSGTKKS